MHWKRFRWGSMLRRYEGMLYQVQAVNHSLNLNFNLLFSVWNTYCSSWHTLVKIVDRSRTIRQNGRNFLQTINKPIFTYFILYFILKIDAFCQVNPRRSKKFYRKSDHLFELAFLIQILHFDVKITESGYYLAIQNAVANGPLIPSPYFF